MNARERRRLVAMLRTAEEMVIDQLAREGDVDAGLLCLRDDLREVIRDDIIGQDHAETVYIGPKAPTQADFELDLEADMRATIADAERTRFALPEPCDAEPRFRSSILSRILRS